MPAVEPPFVRSAIEGGVNEVFLTVVSLCECVIRHALCQLDLAKEPATYLPRQRSKHRFESLAIEEEDVVRFAQPPAIHEDPFDRMLVAQALERGLVVVTADAVVSRPPVEAIAWA